jgi:hypothetical protein
MELYDMELAKARELLAVKGRDPADFTFEQEFLEPDPDGGGMFTVQYAVLITDTASGKTMAPIGGIGMDWVARFEAKLDAGHFA